MFQLQAVDYHAKKNEWVKVNIGNTFILILTNLMH